MPRATSYQESSRDTVKPHISKEDRICSKTRSRETIEHENALSGDLAMSLNTHHIRITKSIMTAQDTMAIVKSQSQNSRQKQRRLRPTRIGGIFGRTASDVSVSCTIIDGKIRAQLSSDAKRKQVRRVSKTPVYFSGLDTGQLVVVNQEKVYGLMCHDFLDGKQERRPDAKHLHQVGVAKLSSFLPSRTKRSRRYVRERMDR